MAFVHKTLRRLQVKKYRQELAEILAENQKADPVIIFPPGLDWHRQLFQRPQQLARALARQGALVFYAQFLNPVDKVAYVWIEDRLYLCNVPLQTFSMINQPIVYSLTWNYKQALELKSTWMIYDYVDELEAFEGNPTALAQAHERLLRQADWVLATSFKLLEQVSLVRSDGIRCPNGVDYNHFARLGRIGRPVVPDDLIPVLEAGKPVIGYHGAMARWMDYNLLQVIASKRDECSFVLIGPDFDRTLPKELVNLPNVYWLGVKKYEELPDYLDFVDVGIIPFLVNKITHATSPLKLFEYMAAGKPVVTTPMFESMQYPGVLSAGEPESYSNMLDKALALKQNFEYLRLLEHTARENTWEMRAKQIISAIAVKTRTS